MKNVVRFVAMIIVISLTICLCGCSIFPKDDTPAVVEMTTTKSGHAIVASSHNGLGMTGSGIRIAIRYVCKITLQDEEDVLNVHFSCEACGHDEVCELKAPASKMFHCDCPEDGDDNNNAREYFCVLAYINSDPESETTG